MKTLILAMLASLAVFAAGTACGQDRALMPVSEDGLYSVSAALVIGEYAYSGGWPVLPGVKKDIQAVTDALKQNGFQVHQSLNPDKKTLISACDFFFSKYGGDSRARLLVYYAGHGSTTYDSGAKNGWLVLKDAKDPAKDAEGFKSQSLPIEYFADKSKTIKAKSALFVFDSCFSGSIFSSLRSIPDFVQEMLRKPSREFITSGTEDQQVPDESVFRRRFVDGINGQADGNGDGVVTGSELGIYIQSEVTKFSGGSQTPVFGKLKDSDGEFVFFSGMKKPEATADKEQTSAADDDEKQRLTAVIKKSPGSKEANDALKRLREIDQSLNVRPPAEAPERKDFTMTAVSKRITTVTQDTSYPYVVIAPVIAKAGSKDVTAAFRVTAKNQESFTKLIQRKEMLRSVIARRIGRIESADGMQEFRDSLKSAASDALSFACPECSETEPVLSGLKVR